MGVVGAGKVFSTTTRQPVSELEAELARLGAENAMLTVEREPLKRRPRV